MCVLMDKWIVCGRLGRPHGVHGALRLWCHNPDTQALEPNQTIYLGVSPKELKHYTLEYVRKDAKSHIVRLKEVQSRQDAADLTHKEWFIQRSAFEKLEDDELYFADLIGLEGRLEDGRSLGTVKQVIEAGAGEILIFKGELGEIMVPYVDAFIARVDLESQVIYVYAVDGLIEGGV